MKKCFLMSTVLLLCANIVMAGGLVTNTNQNAAFLRQLSQDASIDITGAYLNPAGIAFLDNGWHLSLNVQNAKQSRDITTTFPLFAYNENTPNVNTHKFKGNASAPVIPSIQAAYVSDKWSVAANFSLGGGGGKCEFDNGLGTFEALYASQLYGNSATIASAIGNGVKQKAGIDPEYAFSSYGLNAYMKGRQYYFGLSMGGTYKLLDNLSAFGGVRIVYANCNYNGWVEDVHVNLQSKSEYASNLGDYKTYSHS